MALETYQSEFTAEDFENAIRAVPNIGPNGNWFIGEHDTGVYAGGVKVEGAEVGQTIVVTEVDASGNPTKWKAASNASGEFPLVAEVILTEEVSTITIDTDLYGNPIDIAEAYIQTNFKGGTPNEAISDVTAYWNKTNTAVQRHTLGSNSLPAASANTNIPTNQYMTMYHYQKFRYGYTGPGFQMDLYGKWTNQQQIHCLSSAEFNNFVASRFTAFTVYCSTNGYTFGVGTRIRIYGR